MQAMSFQNLWHERVPWHFFVWHFFVWKFFVRIFSSADFRLRIFFVSCFFVVAFFRSRIFSSCIFSFVHFFVHAFFRLYIFSFAIFFRLRIFSFTNFFNWLFFRLRIISSVYFFVHEFFRLRISRSRIFHLPCYVSYVRWPPLVCDFSQPSLIHAWPPSLTPPPSNEFSRTVADEYPKYFDLTGCPLDAALSMLEPGGRPPEISRFPFFSQIFVKISVIFMFTK